MNDLCNNGSLPVLIAEVTSSQRSVSSVFASKAINIFPQVDLQVFVSPHSLLLHTFKVQYSFRFAIKFD